MSAPVLNEITRTEVWLYQTLSTNAAITAIVGARIYAGVMPPEVDDYPALVFQWISGLDDLHTMDRTRSWGASRYLVKGITEGRSALPLQSLMDLVDRALERATGSATDAAITYCRGIRPFRLTTYENNQYFQQVGREWEIAVSAQ